MFRAVHANLRKGREIQLSFLNDKALADCDLLMISEPCIFYINERRTTHTHNKWRPILPVEIQSENGEQTPTRSMIWVKKEQTAVQQIETNLIDIMAIKLLTNNLQLLVIAAYIPPGKGHKVKA